MASSLATKATGTGAGISMADLFSTALAEQERQRAKLASGHATLLAEVSAMEHASPEKRAALMARIVTGGIASGKGVVVDGGDSPLPPSHEHKKSDLAGALATTNQDGDGDDEDEEWERTQGTTTCVHQPCSPGRRLYLSRRQSLILFWILSPP